MKIKDLLPIEEITDASVGLDTEISRISTTPSDGGDGCALFLLKNEYRELGDLYASFSAIICGAEATLPSGISAPVIRVRSVRRAWALAESGIRNIDYGSLRFVGVTGTNGKTTTASLIKEILKDSGEKVGFIGTGKITVDDEIISPVNHSMTTPDPPLLYESIKAMQNAGCTAVVMEVSSHALFYEKVAAIPFEIALFTNLSEEHLDFHRNMTEYLECKLKLLSLSKSAIFNIDDHYFRNASEKCKIPKVTVGILWRGDVYATDVHKNGSGEYEYIYRTENYGFIAKTRLIGKFNVYNSLLALSGAIALGVAPYRAKESLARIHAIEGRCETVADEEVRVVIEYAHTPRATESVLAELRDSKGGGRLIVLFGCGGNRYREKRATTAATIEKYADEIYVTSDNPRNENPSSIIDDIVKGFSATAKYTVIESRREAINAAICEARRGDTVILLGKGAERYNIDCDGYHPFDEREVVREAIMKRGANESKS